MRAAGEVRRLAAAFDGAARTPTAEPRPLAAALNAAPDDDVLYELLETLHELCRGDDERAARGYGEHLVALAALLADDEARRMVLAGVDMFVAQLCCRAGLWAEARERVDRAAADVADLLPGLLGDRAAVLAGCADHEGRAVDAQRHRVRARDGYAGAQRWYDAALAAELVADRSGVDTTSGLAQWRRAAGLFRTAGLPDRARECAEQAGGRVIALIQALQSGQERGVAALARAARELAVEHDLPALAVELRTAAAALDAESTSSWEVLAAEFERCRADHRELHGSGGAAELGVQLAWIDLYAGTAAVQRNRPAEAETLLARAVPAFREAGLARGAEMCEIQLAGLLSSTRPAGTPLDRPDARGWTRPDTHAGRRMLDAMELAGQGRLGEAVAVLGEAGRLARHGGEPHKAVGFDAMAAYLGLAAGDRGAGRRGVERIEAFLAAHDGRVPRAGIVVLTGMAGMLRAELARGDGDTSQYLDHLARTERAMIDLDAPLLAARVAQQRAGALLSAGAPADALAVGLPAALALDALRCALPDATRRMSHATAIAHAFDTAYRAAAAVRDVHALAELLEVSRGNAIPLPRRATDRGDAMSALAPLLEPPEQTVTPVGVFGAAAAAGGAERTALGLAAYVRTPWDTVALARYLGTARRYLDPIRADVTVEWRIRERTP